MPRFNQVYTACPSHVGPSEVAIVCLELCDRREALRTRVRNVCMHEWVIETIRID